MLAVVVGEGVGIMYVGSGVNHRSLLLLILVVCMGGEGVGVGNMFGGNDSVHWSPVSFVGVVSLTYVVVLLQMLQSKSTRFAVCQVGSEKGFGLVVTFGVCIVVRAVVNVSGSKNLNQSCLMLVRFCLGLWG